MAVAEKTGKKTRKESVVVEASVTSCPVCGSIRRSEYHGTVTHEISGITEEGAEFTHVIWKRCECLDCGQHRIDKYRENRGEFSGKRRSELNHE